MKCDKRGFTVVEVVISLVILAIASVSATTAILYGQRAQKAARDRFYATNLCSNSVAVFRAAAGENAAMEGVCEAFSARMTDLLEITPVQPSAGESESVNEGDVVALNAYFDFYWQWVSESEKAEYVCVFTFEKMTELPGFIDFSAEIFEGDECIFTTSCAAPAGVRLGGGT